MIVPQPTAQYGQVDLVSLARAIFSVLSCAYAGFKSKPNTAAAAPPMVVNFRKSRRVGFILGHPQQIERQKRPRGKSFISLASLGVKHDFACAADPHLGQIPCTRRLGNCIQTQISWLLKGSIPKSGRARYNGLH